LTLTFISTPDIACPSTDLSAQNGIPSGDGVEEAFLFSKNVVTVSFHQYDRGFFPGTGKAQDVGLGKGKGFALNVPLREGATDEQYCQLFDSVIGSAINKFTPDCIVMTWYE